MRSSDVAPIVAPKGLECRVRVGPRKGSWKMASWAVDRIEDIPELEPVGDCPIRPVRHHFGITAFGVNAWTAKVAGDRVINEHEEDPGSEELYIVTRGRAVFEL